MPSSNDGANGAQYVTRAELRAQLAVLRSELRADMADLRPSIGELRTNMAELKSTIITTMIALTAIYAGFSTATLTVAFLLFIKR